MTSLLKAACLIFVLNTVSSIMLRMVTFDRYYWHFKG